MSKSINFEEIAKEIFQQHNLIRSSPQTYIPKLENSLKYYKDNKIYSPPDEDPIKTTEGKDSVEDAINFLKNQKPLKKLIFSEEISKACLDHIKDIGPKGMTAHEGSDGKNISETRNMVNGTAKSLKIWISALKKQKILLLIY